jgi:hypothetical protein
MPDNPMTPNTVTPAVRNRSVAQGDVPDAIGRRYYTDGRGGAGLGYYADAKVEKPAFRDEGKRLAAARTDPNAIRDMARIAQHRGWTIVTVRGDPSFRREAWLAARTLGIEVRGHRPTERDIQELDRRIDRRQAAQERSERVRNHPNADTSPVEREARANKQRGGNGSDQLRVVEAVVRSRILEPAAQNRILAAARERVSALAQDGARFRPLRTLREDPALDQSALRGERHRSR